MFEKPYELVEPISKLDALPVDDLLFKARESEDRPGPEGSVEDPHAIKALLDL
jgi:hypothetical protein